MRKLYLGALLLSLMTPAAMATSSRVFVASDGLDTGTCGRSAPCRSFAYAMTQVSARGEVVALDSAGYGTFTVSQSVVVYAVPGANAAVLASSGAAIDISAGPTDSVVLKNLFVNGSGALYGVNFSSGRSLRIENCDFMNFNGLGAAALIADSATDGVVTTIEIDHSTFEQNYTGVQVYMSGVSAIAHVVVRSSMFDNNQTGLYLLDGVRAAVTDSTFAGNSTTGLASACLSGTGATTMVNAERCTISGNHYGASAGGGNGPSTLRLAYCMITDNSFGLNQSTNGTIAGRTDGASNNTNTVEDNLALNTMPSGYAAK